MQADSSCFTPELLSQLVEEEEDQIQCSLPCYLNSVFLSATAANTSTTSPPSTHRNPSNAHQPTPASPDINAPSISNHRSPILFDSPSNTSLTPKEEPLRHCSQSALTTADTHQCQLLHCDKGVVQSSPFSRSRKRKRPMEEDEEEEEKYHPPPSCVLLGACSQQPVGGVVSLLALILQGVSQMVSMVINIL